jgi:hypothetical protein
MPPIDCYDDAPIDNSSEDTLDDILGF